MFKFILIALISSVVLQPALAVSSDPKFFLEDLFSIPPKAEYDKEGSECESNS